MESCGIYLCRRRIIEPILMSEVGMSAKSRNSKPFGLKDRVRISDGDIGMTGIVVALLERDYVRVHWSDCSMPITHGSRVLEIDGQPYDE
jgi:hypothetical protein